MYVCIIDTKYKLLLSFMTYYKDVEYIPQFLGEAIPWVSKNNLRIILRSESEKVN